MSDSVWTIERIEATEDARCAAMIAGDEAKLLAIFAPDATWIHSSGQVDSREAFVEKITSGKSRYLTIERSETTFRICGATAISSGIATMTALANGEARSLLNRYTNIWVSRAEGAVLVSAQSTKLG